MALRELPTPENGRSCYLVSDGEGALSRIADHVEEAMLDDARHIAAKARAMLQVSHSSAGELLVLVSRMHDSLVSVTRLAEIRRRTDAG